MNSLRCRHKNLVLYVEPKDKLRCHHCHLTIKEADLRTRYCPECYEATGAKRFDFEPVEEPLSTKTQYLCEDCGALILVD